MSRLLRTLALALALCCVLPGTAHGAFGLSEMELEFSGPEGPATRAGSHPFAATTSFRVNSVEHPEKKVPVVDGALRNLEVVMPEGFAGNPTAMPRCSTLEFLTEDAGHTACADSTAVGVLTATVAGGKGIEGSETVSIHNMAPSPGHAAKLGFWVGGVPTTVDVGVATEHPYNVVGRLTNATQIVEVLESRLTLWGNPADPAHDDERGDCAYEAYVGPPCSAKIPGKPFLTLPRSCTGPLTATFRALSWWSGDPLHPGPPAFFEGTTQSAAMDECEGLGFSPELEVEPTSEHADAPSGLNASLRVIDEGIGDADGRAHSEFKTAVVTLPEGMTINPSQAEGLATCSEADLARETPSSPFGAGCPAASKIGTVEVESPLLEGEILHGSLFVATPYENRFGSLLAVYQVIKSAHLGIVVKLAGEVEPDPRSGQIVTTFGGPGTDPIPQLPVSTFRLRFREGGRSPLVTPRTCGTYETKAVFTAWANPSRTHTSVSSFDVARGVGGGPCPAAGPPPFEPGFEAGSANNAAGAHSPFLMRLTRRDGDADLVRFDANLPPGVSAKLAGVQRCPEHAIAAAKAKSGREELTSPSCPLGSRIGSVQAGAGVGEQLTYVPGSVYLAGPFGAAPLSVVGVVPAVAGPFDVGTVVVRQALVLDPVTAEVEVDGDLSDSLPHILAGIPLRVRDIQVSVDRPGFALNPTSCERMRVGAELWGGGGNPFSLADDTPVGRAVPFQAADCARLKFKPRLSLRLKGGVRRGANPALVAVLRARRGDANIKRTVVRLPRSAFLEQAHIRTICTRVQFAADACPKGSIYGQVVARTPLLDEPLRGPAYLRSSNNELPDLVFALRGLVEIEAAARIDSVGGGIRAIFPAIPDAPLSTVVVRMQGGKKGLIVNSRNLCHGNARAAVRLDAHNGKRRKLHPLVKAVACKGKGKTRAR